MKVFISADIEGVAGTMSHTECRSTESVYRKYADIMTREVVAACEGALAAGADEVLVKDAHGGATNIDVEMLPRHVRLIRGFSGHPYGMAEGVDGGFDAAMFVGYHSAAGSPGSPMSHTVRGSMNYILLNGRRTSEFMLYSGAAALEGVPSVLLSGDKALCDESRELVPGLHTVWTKDARGVTVITKTPAEVRDELRAAAEQAVRDRKNIALPKLDEHYELEINFKDHTQAYRVSFFPGMEQKDAQTVVMHTDKLFDVLRALRFVL